MGEILFGLIMTLTFTLAAGIVIQEEGRAGARQLVADEFDASMVPVTLSATYLSKCLILKGLVQTLVRSPTSSPTAFYACAGYPTPCA